MPWKKSSNLHIQACRKKQKSFIEGADELYQEIRIENTLTDDSGAEVQLKEGAHVEVTVEAEAVGTTAKPSKSK